MPCSMTTKDECRTEREREVAGTDKQPAVCEHHDNPQPCPLGYGHPDGQPAGPCVCRLTPEFTSDVICCAVEGGIGYWAKVRGYKWNGVPHATANIIEQDVSHKDGVRRCATLDRAKVLLGVERVLHPTFRVAEDIRRQLALAATYGTADFDADVADVVVQAAIFDEIVYG